MDDHGDGMCRTKQLRAHGMAGQVARVKKNLPMFHGDGYDGSTTTSMWLYEMTMASATALHKDDGQRLCHGHGSI